jgi:HEAT repeat protein
MNTGLLCRKTCVVARPEVLRRAWTAASTSRPSEYLRACHPRVFLQSNVGRFFLLTLAVAALFITSAMGRGPMFLDRPVEAWISDLSDANPEVRRGAAFALGKIGAEDSDPGNVVKELTHSLGDKDAVVRDFAASGLGDLLTSLGGRRQPFWAKTGTALQKKLKEDDEPRVRRSAAFALGAFGPDAAPARDGLIAASKDSSPLVRQNAAWALGKLGKEAGADGVEQLRNLLQDSEPLVRRDALHALGEIGNPLAHPAVEAMLQTAGAEKAGVVRKAAVEALYLLVGPDDRKSGQEIYPLLKDKDSETRYNAAFVLAKIGGAVAVEALPVLRAGLKDADSRIQELSAAKIGDIGRDAAPAVDDLGRALVEAKEPQVRCNAAISLGQIGPASKRAIPELIQALRYKDADSPYNGVRPLVAEAIDNIRFPGMTEAIPALLEVIASDPDPQVRERAVGALFKVPDLDKYKITPVLAAVLEETGRETAVTRYEAACTLAGHLEAKAPEKTVDVLLDMLTSSSVKIFNGNETKVSGVGGEGNGGKTAVQLNLGGDARYLAAKGLGWLGRKANRPDVIKALQEAAQDNDRRLSIEAKEALLAIKRTPTP